MEIIFKEEKEKSQATITLQLENGSLKSQLETLQVKYSDLLKKSMELEFSLKETKEKFNVLEVIFFFFFSQNHKY